MKPARFIVAEGRAHVHAFAETSNTLTQRVRPLCNRGSVHEAHLRPNVDPAGKPRCSLCERALAKCSDSVEDERRALERARDRAAATGNVERVRRLDRELAELQPERPSGSMRTYLDQFAQAIGAAAVIAL